MSEAEQLLSGLHDLVEPAEPVSNALMLMLGNALLLVLIGLVAYTLFFRQRYRWRTTALKTISDAREQEPAQALLTLATLLRQIMMHRQVPVSNLTGEPWLQALNREFQTQWFAESHGQLFADALYQPLQPTIEQRDNCCDALQSLVRQLPARKVQGLP